MDSRREKRKHVAISTVRSRWSDEQSPNRALDAASRKLRADAKIEALCAPFDEYA